MVESGKGEAPAKPILINPGSKCQKKIQSETRETQAGDKVLRLPRGRK